MADRNGEPSIKGGSAVGGHVRLAVHASRVVTARGSLHSRQRGRELEQFKNAPVRIVTIVDEYGVLQGIVTQTDLLEAIAGDLPDIEDEEPDVIEREDGSLLIDGMMSSQAALDRLGIRVRYADRDFRTVAGFALFQLGQLPEVGEHFDFEGWRFEIVDMDGRRIDRLIATRLPAPADAP